MAVAVKEKRPARTGRRSARVPLRKPPSGTQPPSPLRMTEEEFVEWCYGEVRAEWIDGEVIVMSPDSFEHADIGGLLNMVLRAHVEDNDLGTIVAPNMQIRLPSRRRRVPDLIFIVKERRDIIQKNHVEGAPDAVFEIVSPDSIERDWRIKYLEYEKAGIREYWIIDPANRQVRQHRLNAAGRYEAIPPEKGVHRSEVIPGFWLKEDNLWESQRISGMKWLRALGVR